MSLGTSGTSLQANHLFIMDNLSEILNRPEYLHALLHPMLVCGLLMGVIALALALPLRSQAAKSIALVLIVIASATAWPTIHYGEAAYDRVQAMSDSAGAKWLEEHHDRAEKLGFVFYILAVVALSALVVPLKWPSLSFPLAVATLALAISSIAIGGWISYPAGRIRHKEFRFGPPPQHSESEHHHH